MELSLQDLAVIGGYAYAIVLGRLFVPWAMHAIPENSERQAKERAAKDALAPLHWHRSALGIVEAVVVVTSVIAGRLEVIAAWVVFKTANAWAGWQNEAGTFNRYAIGNVLSISFGVAGGRLATTIPTCTGDPKAIVGVGLGPVLLTVLIWSLYQGPRWWRRFWGEP